MSSYDAVIFDMDGTIFDSETLYCKSYQTALADQGIDLSAELYFAEFAGKTNPAIEHFVFEQWGNDIDYQKFTEDWPAILATFTKEPIPLMPTIGGLLEDLKQMNIPMAVGSSSNLQEIEHFTRTAKVRDYFSAVAAGDEVTAGKPHPAIFLLAAKRLNVAPEKCIVIEDSNAGVEAGVKAGMKVVLGKTHIIPTQQTLENCIYTDNPRATTLDLMQRD